MKQLFKLVVINPVEVGVLPVLVSIGFAITQYCKTKIRVYGPGGVVFVVELEPGMYAIVDLPDNCTLQMNEIQKQIQEQFVAVCMVTFREGASTLQKLFKVNELDAMKLMNLSPDQLKDNLSFVQVSINEDLLWMAGFLSDMVYKDDMIKLNVDNSVACDNKTLRVEAVLDGLLSPVENFTRGCVFTDDAEGVAYVVFQGNFASRNDDFPLVKSSDIGIEDACMHQGFVEQFASILPQLETCLARLTEWKTIVFCGHSQGGALATLACVWFCLNKKPENKDVKVYTFGTTRLGSAKFSDIFKTLGELYDIDHVRVVCVEDFHPKQSPGLLYRHVEYGLKLSLSFIPKKFWYFAEGTTKGVLELSKDTTSSDDQYSMILYQLTLWHSITNVYLPRLKMFLK